MILYKIVSKFTASNTWKNRLKFRVNFLKLNFDKESKMERKKKNVNSCRSCSFVCNDSLIIILKAIHKKLVEDLGQDWIIYLRKSRDDSSFSNFQYKRLPTLPPYVNLGCINCNNLEDL